MGNRILAAVFGAGLLICGIWLGIYFIGKTRADTQLDSWKETYVELVNTETEEGNGEEAGPGTKEDEKGTSDDREIGKMEVSANGTAKEIEVTSDLKGYLVPDKKIDFSALQRENPDIYSWITIPGTPVDYPIVQRSDELDYYLMHNLNGSYGYPGCIYTQYYNKKDWSDNNTVIYGHNMKDGTMFTALHRYKDKTFFVENSYVYLYTEEEILVYKVFAAYETSDIHLLLAFNTEDKDSFGEYVKGILENEEGVDSHFDRSLKLTGEDKIISLETCIANKPNRRYLVQAVLVARAGQE